MSELTVAHCVTLGINKESDLLTEKCVTGLFLTMPDLRAEE